MAEVVTTLDPEKRYNDRTRGIRVAGYPATIGSAPVVTVDFVTDINGEGDPVMSHAWRRMDPPTARALAHAIINAAEAAER